MHTTFSHRNKQKAAKNVRHEAEKLHMVQRQEVGIAVGQYQGGGQGETVDPGPEVEQVESVEPNEPDVSDHYEDDNENDSENAVPSSERPLLFFFDVETTGLGVYSDFIIDIAAKVFDIPTSAVSQPTYQSLVRTSKTIPMKGRNMIAIMHYCVTITHVVVKLTGIRNTDLLGERPLSVVLLEFLTWVSTTTREYTESTGNSHFPGIFKPCAIMKSSIKHYVCV